MRVAQSSEENPWTNAPWDEQTDFSYKPAQEQQQAQKQNPETVNSAIAWLQVPTWRHLWKRSQTGAHVTNFGRSL